MVKTGEVSSTTVKVAVLVVVLPQSSVAMNITSTDANSSSALQAPKVKVGAAGDVEKVTVPQASFTLNPAQPFNHSWKAASVSEAQFTVRSAAGSDSTGSSLSSTVMT